MILPGDKVRLKGDNRIGTVANTIPAEGRHKIIWPRGMMPSFHSSIELDLVESKPAAAQKDEPAWKQDAGKARIDLIAPEFLFGTAAVLEFGAAKYAERNWEKGMSWGRCFGALMRHMWAWWGGEQKDAETGMSHLAHAACCLMFLMAYENRKIGTDDRSA